ncbi:MAG: lytic transglycosylase domain-containing protein [Rhodobacteraceae bacterium]|nr:lytic transglycosylase domain-containing protein [Paracoccaceae bacterium]
MALVIRVAQDEGIDPLDFLALAWTESAFDPIARAGGGSTAKGVLQFADRTAKAYGLTDPFTSPSSLIPLRSPRRWRCQQTRYPTGCSPSPVPLTCAAAASRPGSSPAR